MLETRVHVLVVALSPSFVLPTSQASLFLPRLPHTLLVGGNGYINDYPTGRLLRDAKLYEIGAGTSEIRRIVIGRAFNALFKD